MFKRKPYAHQQRAFDACKDRQFYGLLMEQRTGKTLVAINKTLHDYHAGRVNAMLIIAPEGVNRNWITDAMPEDWPDDVPYTPFIWRASRIPQKGVQKQLLELLTAEFPVIAINIEAITTMAARKYLAKFLHRRKVASILDESLDIGTPGAKRSRVAVEIGKRSHTRLILEGTPSAAGPLALYNQFQFLKPGVLGFSSFTAFKNRYAVYEEQPMTLRRQDGSTYDVKLQKRGDDGRPLFQNMEELSTNLYKHAIRVLRRDCADLPPKIYQKRYFELSPEQNDIYARLHSEFIAELSDERVVDARMVLKRYLRLQQVASGFVVPEPRLTPCPDCEGVECLRCDGIGMIPGDSSEEVIIGNSNPRLHAFRSVHEKLADQPGIVWARFRHDIVELRRYVKEHGLRAGFYTGKETADERAESKALFQDGKLDLVIGNAKAGGRGLDLSKASWMVYYSNEFSLRTRLQSEDRAQHLKKTDATLYIDLIAENTVDEKIIESLRGNRNIANAITKDNWTKWI